MIDWSEIVADAALNLPKNEAKGPSSDSTCRKKPDFSESVGTAETRANTGIYVVSSDIPTVPSDFERQRVGKQEKTNPLSFIEAGGGGGYGESAPHKTALETSCRTCAHMRRPGLSDGLCSGRQDLPHAFTPGHPLRRLPDDGGRSCPAWALHESMVTRSPQSDERRTS